jgi:F-type H+-transporting ATPase subunit delta
LPPDLQAGIEAGLKRRYGPGLSTAFAHRPALIGGMRIQVGSDVYDGSVRAGLAALEKSF